MLCSHFDEIIIPEEIAAYYPKKAIFERNKWMVDRCQYMIAYVHRTGGGAWDMMRYTCKQGLHVFNVAE